MTIGSLTSDAAKEFGLHLGLRLAFIVHTFDGSPRSSSLVLTQPPRLAFGRSPAIQKGSMMTPQFLRHEAARFRGMAEDADREATKARLLAMAADYEARAGIDNELPEPNSGEANEPAQDAAPTVNIGTKVTAGLKETVLGQRRPVGRPRRV